jgi:hypothetical protein
MRRMVMKDNGAVHVDDRNQPLPSLHGIGA